MQSDSTSDQALDAAALDRLGRLRAAGIDLDTVADDQLEVLAGLRDDEIDLLLDVRGRLADTAAEVEAHSVRPMTIGGLFF